MGLLLKLLTPQGMTIGVIAIALGLAFYIMADRAILKQELKNFKATEAQNNERNETNETIRKADAASKCELIGGELSDTGECI